MARDEIWDALKQHKKEKFDADRARFLKSAKEQDDGGWTKHTEYHWSRMINGTQLDYWPSRKKYRYKGQTKRGNVYAFIKQQEKKNEVRDQKQ